MFINSKSEFNQFIKEYNKSDSIIIPIFSDANQHPINNTLCLLYIELIDNRKTYILPFNHSESINLDLELLEKLVNDKLKYTSDKKNLVHAYDFTNIIDTNSLNFEQNNQIINEHDLETPAHHFIYNKFQDKNNLNQLVPLTKHYEYCKNIATEIYNVAVNSKLGEAFYFVNDISIPNLAKIERNGLFASPGLVKSAFDDKALRQIDKNSKVYTQYNLLTSTGRPSNRFGGINYAALSIEKGTRDPFISRFGSNGVILMYDYDAYHLRLIGDLINYEFPKSPVHQYLGKQYFDTKKLTDEQYQESKAISFKLLYGGIPKKYRDIPFYAETDVYVKQLWAEYKRNGYIESPISKRRIKFYGQDKPTPQKLFNYLLQLIETESNMVILTDIHNMCEKYKSVIALYIYDAFIFDFSFSDGLAFMKKMKDLLERGGKFPVKASYGVSYGKMEDITYKFK